jgi:hypothetical protein
MQPLNADGGGHSEGNSPRTMASMFLRFRKPDLNRQLEEFRVGYEELHGPTDLTKRSTSLLPISQQHWLLQNHPKRYFDGLPPFVQAFFFDKMSIAHKEGRLDDMPGPFIQLYLCGEMDMDRGFE